MWEGKDIGDYSNPTFCQLGVVNKVNIQKTPTHNIGVVAHSYSHYAEQIKVAVNVMRARKT